MPHATHKALAVTGAVGIAMACASPGTLANQLAPAAGTRAPIRIEHPSGRLDLSLSQQQPGGPIAASLVRTARKIFEGAVFIRLPKAWAQAGIVPFAKSA